MDPGDVWNLAGKVKWPSREFDQSPIATQHPINAEEDGFKLAHPDIATAGIIPLVTEFIEIGLKARQKGEDFDILLPVGGPFSIASNFCGAEQLCRWIMKKTGPGAPLIANINRSLHCLVFLLERQIRYRWISALCGRTCRLKSTHLP